MMHLIFFFEPAQNRDGVFHRRLAHINLLETALKGGVFFDVQAKLIERGGAHAAKLATREDSERSWTIDLSARRAKAAADAQPFKDTARAKSQEAERGKDRLGELKKAKPRDETAVADAEGSVTGFLKAAREATNKADDIENAVYDLKAVNPNRKAEVDHRTPAELLDLIEVKGREIATALSALRALQDRG